MSANQTVQICTHIKTSGIRCGSPALRGEIFCYFHQRLIRGVRTPPKSRLHPMAILEDPKSIQVSLMEIVNALARNTIDFRRAQLILRALYMASKNARYAQFGTQADRMVQEVPKYPAAPKRERTESEPRPILTDEEKRRYDNQEWDWDDIRRKIREGTYYDPRLEEQKLRAAAAAEAAERNPPQNAKLLTGASKADVKR